MQPANTFAILLVTLLLSACGTNILPWQSSSAKTSAEENNTGTDEVALRTTPTARVTEPAKSSLKIDDDPQKLVGLSPGGLADRLGSPGFVRQDGSAEIWQYLAAACILDVFLYRDKDVLTVDYVELRGRGASQLSRRDCYREMLRTHLTAERG